MDQNLVEIHNNIKACMRVVIFLNTEPEKRNNVALWSFLFFGFVICLYALHSSQFTNT